MTSSQLKRSVISLSVMAFCYSAFQGLCLSLAPLSMAEHELSKTTIGLLLAVPGLTALLCGAPLARLANTRRRRATLTFAFVLTAIASLLYGRASRPVTFIVPQVLYGLSSSAFWSNMVASSFRLADGPRQAKIQTYVTTLQGVGAFAGPLLGGYLSTRSYTIGFYAGLFCAVVGLIASRWMLPTPPLEPVGSVREFVLGAYVRLFRVVTRRPLVILGVCFVAMNCFLLYVLGGSFYLLYASQIGLSAFIATALVAGRDAISSVLRLGFSTISRYVSPVVLLGGGVILGAISLGLLPLATSLLGVSLVAVAQGVFLAFLPPAANTLVGSSTAPEEQSFAIMGFNSGNFLAQTAMSPLIGLLLTHYDYGVVYPVVGVVWGLLAVAVLSLALRLTRSGMHTAPVATAPAAMDD